MQLLSSKIACGVRIKAIGLQGVFKAVPTKPPIVPLFDIVRDSFSSGSRWSYDMRLLRSSLAFVCADVRSESKILHSGAV
jgi:hypothetical protein